MDKGSEELRRNEEIRNKGELRKEFLAFKTTDFASSMLWLGKNKACNMW